MEDLPESNPAPFKEPGQALAGNPFIRCPLPPFNATSDTLRQFNESGKTPTRRVIPLPVQVGAGGSTTIIQNTNVTSQSGGGSGGNVPVVVSAKTVTVNVATLLPGEASTFILTAARVAVLMILGASDFCEVRIYGDPSTQGSDLPRQSDTAVPFEVTPGVVTDVILDTNPLQFNWQNRLFVNQDSPQTTNLYITVLNPTAGAVTPSVTITYLPLE